MTDQGKKKDPEMVLKRAQWDARVAYQKALDLVMAGDPVALAALMERYRPIIEYQKDGPDVGQRDEAESEAGRIN